MSYFGINRLFLVLRIILAFLYTCDIKTRPDGIESFQIGHLSTIIVIVDTYPQIATPSLHNQAIRLIDFPPSIDLI